MDDDDLVVASLHLGFYLASWGMMRGSGDLLQNSVYSLRPVVQAIAREQPSTWDIDVNKQDYRRDVLALYGRIEAAFTPINASNILVTKTMLGVFGCIPAFDRFFRTGFGHWTVNERNIDRIASFYRVNMTAIDGVEIRTLDVNTGLETDRSYPRAKIIDMYYFQKGGGSPAKA